MHTYVSTYLSISPLRAENCTPEMDTSDIIVDFQWQFPMDFQWHFQTDVHLTVVCSKGLSLSQWMAAGNVEWTFSGLFLR